MTMATDLIAATKMIKEMLEKRLKSFCASVIFLSRFLMLLFDCSTMFPFISRFFDTLIIISKTQTNFSSYACKDFCFYKMLSICFNIALIIACRHISSLSRIACIIWTYPTKISLLNYSPIAQACIEDLTIGTIDVKLCSLRYVDYSNSKSSIRFIK